MSPAHQRRTAGFLASLSQRGVSVFVPPDDTPLKVILEPVPANDGQFGVARETGNGIRVHVLRDHLDGRTIGMGTVLKHDPAGFVFRVTDVEDNPASVTVVFTCEATPL